jgi:hypothetical protein
VDTEWELVFVRPRFESHVVKQLRQQNVECYLPTFRRGNGLKTIELPLFPGYVYCKMELHRSLSISLVTGVLRVSDCEHCDIGKDVENLRRVNDSELRYGPWPYMKTGALSIAADGPLSGIDGFVMGGNRFIIPIRSVLRSVIVDVGITSRFVSADSSYEANSA